MTVRELVFAAITSDPVMEGYGINASTLFASSAPVSPTTDVFGVLHWGPESQGLAGQRGIGKVTERDVTLWVYDTNLDYTRIADSLKRWCMLMDSLTGQRTGSDVGDGWVTCCEWAGDGDDIWDDAYERITRWSAYTIIASGN